MSNKIDEFDNPIEADLMTFQGEEKQLKLFNAVSENRTLCGPFCKDGVG